MAGLLGVRTKYGEQYRTMYDMSREPLSRDRVLRAALAVADDGGLHGLTIRSLAQRLGVEADVALPLRRQQGRDPRRPGRPGLRRDRAARADGGLARGDGQAVPVGAAGSQEASLVDRAARVADDARVRPRFATTTRTSARCVRVASRSPQTGHAYAVLDAFVYGFAVQEASLPFEGPDGAAEVAGPIMELMEAGRVPPHGGVRRASTRCSRATTSATSSTSASTWSSTASPGCSRADLPLTGSADRSSPGRRA